MECEFKNIKFFCEKISTHNGRNLSVTTIPFSEDQIIRDIGASDKKISLQGYVIGGNHRDQAKNLMNALNEPGTGKLLHPAIGLIDVMCLKHVFVINKSGNITNFSIEFIRGKPIEIGKLVPEKDFNDLETSSLKASEASFLDAVNSYLDASDDLIDGAQRYMNQTMDAVQPFINSARNAIDRISQSAAFLRELKHNINTLASAPGNLISHMKMAMDDIKDAILETGAMRQDLLMRSVDMVAQPLTEDHDSPEYKTWAYLEISNLTYISKYIVKELKKDSESDITRPEDILSKLIEKTDLHLETINPQIFDSLSIIKRSLGNLIEEENKKIKTYTLNDITPPICLAWEISKKNSQSIDEIESDILSRNRFKHPGFLPADAFVEVRHD